MKRLASATVLVIALALGSLLLGRYPLTLNQLLAGVGGSGPAAMVVSLRVVRLLAVVLVGAGLGMAGTTYQAVFANGLASPNVLGVATGAAVGAAFAILANWPLWAVQLCAFTTGLVTVAATLSLAKVLPERSRLNLVLAGMLTGGLMSSLLGSIKYLADPEDSLPTIIYWEMGSFAKVNASTLWAVAPVLIACMVALWLLRWRLTVMSLDAATIFSLGIHPKRSRNLLVTLATVLTAGCVCLCGVVGWVGLVVPHVARGLAGVDERHALPMAAMCGAGLMVLADTLARTVSVNDIPLSIVTGFIGVPLLVLLLTRRTK